MVTGKDSWSYQRRIPVPQSPNYAVNDVWSTIRERPSSKLVSSPVRRQIGRYSWHRCWKEDKAQLKNYKNHRTDEETQETRSNKI